MSSINDWIGLTLRVAGERCDALQNDSLSRIARAPVGQLACQFFMDEQGVLWLIVFGR